jgi:hypothetical protein
MGRTGLRPVLDVRGSPRRPPRRSRHRFRHWWERNWWLVLASAAITAFVLAFVGAKGDFLTRMNTALRLLPLGFSETSGLSPALQAARFIAPLVFAYATLRAVTRLFDERLEDVRAGRARGHSVVCGLGGQGTALVEGLLELGKVVAIERDPTSLAVRACRDAGATVLVGDAAEPDLLRRANVNHAQNVLVTCGRDAVNAQVVANLLHAAAPRQGRMLLAYAAVSDPRMYLFLLGRSFARPRVHLEFFNVYERGAKALLAASPREPDGPVLVLGAGRLGRTLVSELGRRRFERAAAPGENLEVHVVDLHARARCDELLARYSRLGDVCDLLPHELDVESPRFDELLADMSQPGVAFICFDDDAVAIGVTLGLLRQARTPFPIVARVSDQTAGFSALLEEDQRRLRLTNYRPVSITKEVCRAERVLEGRRGQLAREAHETHRRLGLAGPYDVPWSRLSEQGRERNLRHADDIARQLERAGYRLGPLLDWGEPLLSLPPADVEAMSEMEHERWMAERLQSGWRYGPVRDDDARVHPDLVQWAELPEDRKDINRALVLERPAMLARADIELARLSVDELVARAIHDAYLEHRMATGAAAGSEPSLETWDVLAPELQASSHGQACNVLAVLGELGYRIVPAERDVEPAVPGADERELIARRVHEAWAEQREDAGWRTGAARDDELRLHPDLVPWEELPEDRRDIDRHLVERLPQLLGAAGLVITRATESAAGAARTVPATV